MGLALLTAACTTTRAQPEETPTPEVFIGLKQAVLLPQADGSIAGTALWGTSPVLGAQVEVRMGARATNTVAARGTAIAEAAGQFVLEEVAASEYGLVALWPDGGANVAACKSELCASAGYPQLKEGMCYTIYDDAWWKLWPGQAQ